MPKRKLQRFDELEHLQRVFQFPYPLLKSEHGLPGNWGSKVFGNDHPLILELGCGRGEYTVNLARNYPHSNFIGVDIKGARIWRGAKTANEENLLNAAFLRVHIEWLRDFFNPGEVKEIWLTFPDPQPQLSRENRRLSNPRFLQMYRHLMDGGGIFHLKTDNSFFFNYTLEQLAHEKGELEICTHNLYAEPPAGFNLSIQTTYEQRFLAQGMPIHYLRFRME